MLIQYIIDSPPQNTTNERGNWILLEQKKQLLKKGSALKSAFDWDTKSKLRIHFHKFASAERPMDSDGLAISFKAVRDAIIDSLTDLFKQKPAFNDGDEHGTNARFFYVYSQCKAIAPVFANTIVITIDLMPSDSPYISDSGVVKQWGYIPTLIDKASLIADLRELRAEKIDEIVAELKRSRTGTKKVANLEKELKAKQKAIALCG